MINVDDDRESGGCCVCNWRVVDTGGGGVATGGTTDFLAKIGVADGIVATVDIVDGITIAGPVGAAAVVVAIEVFNSPPTIMGDEIVVVTVVVVADVVVAAVVIELDDVRPPLPISSFFLLPGVGLATCSLRLLFEK